MKPVRRSLTDGTFNVGVVGAGYVGLVTATCLAHLGHRVVCVDKDEERVEGLTEGWVPFYEPGLEQLMARVATHLSFTTGLATVVRESDAIFVSVDTPQEKDGS